MTVTPAMAMKRRQVRLEQVSDLRREVELICTHRVRTLGEWNEAQILDHVAKLIEFAYAGFPFRAPWIVRVLARRLLLSRCMRKGFKPGFKLPASARILLPDPDITLAAAAARMGAVLARLERGEPMTHPSPVFGPLTHDQWVRLQLRHAEHHFSFILPEEQPR